ncbi:hypothetical protein BJF90_40140 [Pseudonocardia sp. CNS-004]|nr:hypothetical protein BJF90_40140 [Pseudonocardia sp. CNS-004]
MNGARSGAGGRQGGLAREVGQHAAHLRLADLRWPPGVRIEPIRPADAQRVTVLGSTRKSAATSPGVSRRSLLPVCAVIDIHDLPERGVSGPS